MFPTYLIAGLRILHKLGENMQTTHSNDYQVWDLNLESSYFGTDSATNVVLIML